MHRHSVLSLAFVAASCLNVWADEAGQNPASPEEVKIAAGLEGLGVRLIREKGRVVEVQISSPTRVTNANVTDMRNLAELRAFSNGPLVVDNEVFSDLLAIPKLTELSLTTRAVTPGALANLERFKQLKVLWLKGPAGLRLPAMPDLTDERLAEVRFPPDLEWLALFHAPEITDAGMQHLSSLKKLRRLDLTTPQVTDAGLRALHGLTNIRSLFLMNTRITGNGIAELPWRGQIERFMSRTFDDSSVDALALAGCDRMTWLSFEQSSITDSALRALPQRWRLSYLNLGHTAVTDTGLKSLSKLERVEKLVLTECKNVTDKGLEALREVRTLKWIMLVDTQVTPGGAKALKTSLPEVEIVPASLLK